MIRRLPIIVLCSALATYALATVVQADEGSQYRTDHVDTSVPTTADLRVAYATSQVGTVYDGSTIPWTDTWSGYCDAFAVATVLAGEGNTTPLSSDEVFANALTHYQWALNNNLIHTTPPPPGALVFYDTGTETGHVAVSVEDGLVVTTQGDKGDHYEVAVTSYLNIPGYLGWSWY